MDSNSGRRARVPSRYHRHDGWTPDRQERFLDRLQGSGCVTEACRAVGLSSTSAYRAYHRMPEFAISWNRALDARRPMLEDAAFKRTVHGATQPVTRLGKVVGQRRRYSDSLLRFLIEREDRRHQADAEAKGRHALTLPSPEETDRLILERLELLSQRRNEKLRAEAIAFADRMRAEGKAP